MSQTHLTSAVLGVADCKDYDPASDQFSVRLAEVTCPRCLKAARSQLPKGNGCASNSEENRTINKAIRSLLNHVARTEVTLYNDKTLRARRYAFKSFQRLSEKVIEMMRWEIDALKKRAPFEDLNLTETNGYVAVIRRVPLNRLPKEAEYVNEIEQYVETATETKLCCIKVSLPVTVVIPMELSKRYAVTAATSLLERYKKELLVEVEKLASSISYRGEDSRASKIVASIGQEETEVMEYGKC